MAIRTVSNFFPCSLIAAVWVVAAAASGAVDSMARDAPGRVATIPEVCSSYTDCGACIRVPGCKWCASSDVVKSRCVDKTNATGRWCEGVIFDPSTNYKVLVNETNGRQIFPQHATLKLRIGEIERITFSFNKSEDYPIDLYYLMDLSQSMRIIKDTISRIGGTLAGEMRKITRNFRMGFGSFVDKVELPFTITTEKRLNNPCVGGVICSPPHSFINHLALNNDPSLFSKIVAETELSSNLDAPEGGFDALMQAIVCTDKIKWRSDARHLLFFTTDQTFHMAGDGKLAGAVDPNPGICLMNDREYTAYKDYDYPTISQISRKAEEHNINIIFAVTEEVRKLYSMLSDNISGSKSEIITEDAHNLVKIITDIYNEFDKTVKIIDDSRGTGIKILYHTQCMHYKELMSINMCHNVPAGQPVSFSADVSVQSCPQGFTGTTWKKSINISPQGINEVFRLDLEVICKCDCEIPGYESHVEKSPSCNYKGTSVCGICKCDEGWTGQTCKCDRKSTVIKEKDDINQCITNTLTQQVCNGRGSCVCGQCSCNKRPPGEYISGKHCECDNFSCPKIRGSMCSGKGRCMCRQCICDPGWKGEACECLETQSECIAPGEDVVCSGHGICGCKGCECFEGRSGKYCSDCVTCPGGRCNEFADCVECLVYKTGKHAANKCADCHLQNLNIVKSIGENLTKGERLCKIPDEAGCSFVFTYLENTEVSFRVEKEKECSAAIPLLGIILGVTGTTLLLGILIIVIWKILTSIHDRREYEKYVAQLENTKWAVDENPLHQKPTTTTINPTFNRKSRFSFMLRS